MKAFVCSECALGTKLVGFVDESSTYTSYDSTYGTSRLGCTINELPNAIWYLLSTAKDANNKFYYTTKACPGIWANYLVVPGINAVNYDYSKPACGVSADPSVAWW